MGLFRPNIAKLSKNGDTRRLVGLLGHSKLAKEASEALVRIGRPSFEHLVAALHGTDKVICAGAVGVLHDAALLGNVDKVTLNQLLADKNFETICRIYIAESLARNGDPAALSQLISFLTNEKLDRQRESFKDTSNQAKKLKTYDPATSAELEALAERMVRVITMMELKHKIVKMEVEAALVRLGEKVVVGPLTKAAKSPHPDIQTSAAAVLTMMGQVIE
jgi:HEAT repeat protein